ncbi:MAG: hypothetical protein D3910_25880 [Candidatus Electrothrix sp. ATG2]|nr:hypothetical protein [Candidatus Electrothrix sp. ATG2]
MSRANLSDTILVKTNFENSILVGCNIYGCSAWDLKLSGCNQQSLVISKQDEPLITVDDIDVAQFMRLILRNKKVRNIIDIATSKIVLILGRFTEERLLVLESLRKELRTRNLIPILFDFDKPASKDTTATVELLARLARFIVADITDPSSVPHELATIVPFLRNTPIISLKLRGASGFGMFNDFVRSYSWVLPTHEYDDAESLIDNLSELILKAEEKEAKLRSNII